MMEKIYHWGRAVALAAVLAACVGRNPGQRERTGLVGNDRDSHGCIASAGYQWSELLGECIRPFEKGIRLESCTGNGNDGKAAYLVFDADSGRVEIFLPEKGKCPVSDRVRGEKGNRLWKGKSSSGYEVVHAGNVWEIRLDGRRLFVRGLSSD